MKLNNCVGFTINGGRDFENITGICQQEALSESKEGALQFIGGAPSNLGKLNEAYLISTCVYALPLGLGSMNDAESFTNSYGCL